LNLKQRREGQKSKSGQKYCIGAVLLGYPISVAFTSVVYPDTYADLVIIYKKGE
jgi:hypothetical protein